MIMSELSAYRASMNETLFILTVMILSFFMSSEVTCDEESVEAFEPLTHVLAVMKDRGGAAC